MARISEEKRVGYFQGIDRSFVLTLQDLPREFWPRELFDESGKLKPEFQDLESLNVREVGISDPRRVLNYLLSTIDGVAVSDEENQSYLKAYLKALEPEIDFNREIESVTDPQGKFEIRIYPNINQERFDGDADRIKYKAGAKSTRIFQIIPAEDFSYEDFPRLVRNLSEIGFDSERLEEVEEYIRETGYTFLMYAANIASLDRTIHLERSKGSGATSDQKKGLIQILEETGKEYLRVGKATLGVTSLDELWEKKKKERGKGSIALLDSDSWERYVTLLERKEDSWQDFEELISNPERKRGELQEERKFILGEIGRIRKEEWKGERGGEREELLEDVRYVRERAFEKDSAFNFVRIHEKYGIDQNVVCKLDIIREMLREKMEILSSQDLQLYSRLQRRVSEIDALLRVDVNDEDSVRDYLKFATGRSLERRLEELFEETVYRKGVARILESSQVSSDIMRGVITEKSKETLKQLFDSIYRDDPSRSKEELEAFLRRFEELNRLKDEYKQKKEIVKETLMLIEEKRRRIRILGLRIERRKRRKEDTTNLENELRRLEGELQSLRENLEIKDLTNLQIKIARGINEIVYDKRVFIGKKAEIPNTSESLRAFDQYMIATVKNLEGGNLSKEEREALEKEKDRLSYEIQCGTIAMLQYIMWKEIFGEEILGGATEGHFMTAIVLSDGRVLSLDWEPHIIDYDKTDTTVLGTGYVKCNLAFGKHVLFGPFEKMVLASQWDWMDYNPEIASIPSLKLFSVLKASESTNWQDPDKLNNLSLRYFDFGQYEVAREIARKACEITNYNDPFPIQILAFSLTKIGLGMGKIEKRKNPSIILESFQMWKRVIELGFPNDNPIFFLEAMEEVLRDHDILNSIGETPFG